MTESETALMVHQEQGRTAMVYDRVEPMQFVETMGKAFALSGAGGCKTAGDGQVMALACLCEGKTIFEIARRYHLMDGKLGLKSESMLADFRKLGGKHRWLKDGIDGIEASVELTGPDGQVIVSSMTIDRAKAAGYVKPGSNWIKRPDQMLRARCTTDGIRMGWPEIAGDYTVEEISENGVETTVVPAKPSRTKAQVEQRAAELKAMNGKALVEDGVIDVVAEPAKAVNGMATALAPTTTVESAPFDVGQSTTTETTGDANESDLPSISANDFQSNVMEIEILLPKCGWTPEMIIPHYNKKWGTDHNEFGQFDEEQQAFILTKVREVVAKNEAGELASK